MSSLYSMYQIHSFVYNPVRHNMQMLFLQNQINAIHYKVGGDSPRDDKPVEPGFITHAS